MEEELDGLRKQINQVDVQLVKLLNERASIALHIGKVKAQHGVKPYDPTRERVVLERVTQLNGGPLGKGAIEELFADIITVCREIQNQ